MFLRFQNLSINLSFLLTGYTGPLSHRAAPVHPHGGSTQLHTRAKQVRKNKKNVENLLYLWLQLNLMKINFDKRSKRCLFNFHFCCWIRNYLLLWLRNYLEVAEYIDTYSNCDLYRVLYSASRCRTTTVVLILFETISSRIGLCLPLCLKLPGSNLKTWPSKKITQ